MLQNQLADLGDKMFDDKTAKIIRSHALWASFIMAFPFFGVDLIFYCFILWDMYGKLCKAAKQPLNVSNIIVGFIVNIVIALVVDTLLSFIPVIGWLGTSFIVYFQFYSSGKAFLETLKKKG